jgi:hypothetical protein
MLSHDCPRNCWLGFERRVKPPWVLAVKVGRPGDDLVAKHLGRPGGGGTVKGP